MQNMAKHAFWIELERCRALGTWHAAPSMLEVKLPCVFYGISTPVELTVNWLEEMLYALRVVFSRARLANSHPFSTTPTRRSLN